MEWFSDAHIWWLLIIGFSAGLMDAAVGGGGLLQIPGLFGALPAQTSVPVVLGVNKFASASGTLVAAVQYTRRIPVPWAMLVPAAILAFIFSYLGSHVVVYLPTAWMKPSILVILIVMAVYTFLKKDLGQVQRQSHLSRREYVFGLFMGALIGLYDGIFGPGTGSLLAFIFVRFFAFDFITATASSKVINLTTNLAALIFFIPNHYVVWHWAIPLAAANLIGGLIGARLAMRGGSKLLRKGFIILLCIMIGKFGCDLL
ncbi:putative membrane protein [Snodgrassella communis]|uniref:Probable membrane transporter protein n=1 Tax=Snodgrassella communis TaxID=2946699 RepID=A0A836MQC3_9NEIS|nr:TSUP family transporter [Snodgrassella communis]KDN15091.1 putative membrane protein [Snodgrassella communis]